MDGYSAERGYERKEIQRAVEKTSRKDRWEMIEQIERNRNKSVQKEEGEVVQIPFIMTFNQHGKEIRKILKDRQPLLDSAFRRTKVRPRLSYRRRRNLNDAVVHYSHYAIVSGFRRFNFVRVNKFKYETLKCGKFVRANFGVFCYFMQKMLGVLLLWFAHH